LVSWYGSVVPLETVLSLPNLAGQTRAALLLPAIITQHLESQELYTAAKSLAVPLPAENFGIFLTGHLHELKGNRKKAGQRPVPEALPDTSQRTSSFLLGTVWAS